MVNKLYKSIQSPLSGLFCFIFIYMNLPFTENKQEGHFLRTFEEQVDEIDLKWHRDLEDRIVEPTTPTDWKVQLEDQLPESIDKQIFIPRFQWHRLIKGTNKLTLKVAKL